MNGTFFLTMNITRVAHTGNYTAQIFKQNITINQTADGGNTGNDTATTEFTTLMVDPADVDVYDAPLKHIAPGKTYAAYNITYYENASDATGANLTWFNVSEMNATIPNNASLDDITNVSVWNSTKWQCLGSDTTPPFHVNLSNEPVADNSTYNLTIMINTSRTMDTGDWFKNVSINATLYDNETVSAGGLTANDLEPERIIRVEINEIMYDPEDVQGTTSNEWVELHNTNTTTSINVGGWNLTDVTSGEVSTIPTETVIEPNGSLIIARNATLFKSYYHWVNESLVIDGSMQLNNDGDTINLTNSTGAEIDNVTYDDGWGADGNGKTLERNGNEYVTQADMWSESKSYSGTPADINSIIDPEPYITDYFSHDTTQTAPASTTFGVKANKTVDVTWYRNGRVVHTETGVDADSWSNYTASAIIGYWNITATISGSPVNDTMTWIWDCGRIYDSPKSLVSPGKSYIAYNVSFNGTKFKTLTWFNVSEMNASVSNTGDIDDIVNVSVWNFTESPPCINYSNTRPFNVNLSDFYVDGNNTYNLTINLTVALDSFTEPDNIAINASLYNTTTSLVANDPAPEYTEYKTVYPDSAHTATISLNRSEYGKTSTARISVDDPDYNKKSGVKEIIKVRVWSDFLGSATANYMEVPLTETTVDSGVFNGTMTFNPGLDSHDDANDVLAAKGDNTVYVRFKDNENVSYNVQYREDTAIFRLASDGTVTFDKDLYNTSESPVVSVEDPDLDVSDDPDTAKVTINSTVNESGYYENITLPLTETEPHSFIFNGTFNFTTTGSSSSAEKLLRVNGSTTTMVFDTITVNYTDEKNASYMLNYTTDVAAFNNTHTGEVSLNQTVYKDGDALNVTLYDPDLNTNTSATDWVLNASNYTLMFINTTNLSAYSADPSGYDSENITNITETGINTGNFTNTTITLNATTGVVNKDNGELNVTPGGGFAVVYFDYLDEYGTNHSNSAALGYVNESTANATAATYQTADVSVWWNTSGNITGDVINVTEDNVWGKDTVARISVDDADGGGKSEELDPDARDNITVNVNSTENTTGIYINLTETGDDTGVFNGTLKFGKASSAATRTIEVNSSDKALVSTTINVNFNDTKNATQGAEWINKSFTHWWTVNGTAKVWNGTVNGTVDSPVIFYNTTTATVYVEDSDRNNDTTVYNTFNVTIWNGTTDRLEITLNETTNKSGIFEGTFNFSEAGDPSKLNVSDGCPIYVNYSDTNTSLGNVTTWFNYTYGTYKKTRDGTVGLWKLNPVVGESGNITLDDYDRNINSSISENVTVYVYSNTTGPDNGINITLNETGPGTHIFNGTLNFSTTTTDETLNQIEVSDGDNITIRYVDPLNISGKQETVTNSSAWVRVRYSGIVWFNKSTYLPNETALITLDDMDLNTDPYAAETHVVNVNSSDYSDGINVTLKETGKDTGIFNRTITFTLAPNPPDEPNRIINVSIGGTINVTYNDTINATGDTYVLVTDNATIVKTADSLSIDRTHYNASHTAHVTLVDSDLNTDSTLKDTSSLINVNSTSDSAGFNITVEETGPDTGEFTGWFKFKVGGPSDATERLLNVTTGDTINVTYSNAANKTGQSETMVKQAIFDNLVPTINVSVDKSVVNVSENVTINVTASDNVTTAENLTVTAMVDNENVSLTGPVDNNWTGVFATDVAGNYTVTAKATDEAGNSATNTTTVEVRVPPIHDINVTTDYEGAVNGIKITRDGTDVVGADENLTIGKTYTIRYKLVNEGNFTESVDVTVSVANVTGWNETIGTHTYSLDVGESNTYSDEWNTTGLTAGTYTITVNASIAKDANPADNERTRDVMLTIKLGAISGVISYACNGTGIDGATVNLTKDGTVVNTTTTNETGYYSFTKLETGDYYVNVSKPRFWDNSTAVTVSAGETAKANLMLWLKGDLDNDGKSGEIDDLSLMLKAYMGNITPDWKYDLDKDGTPADIDDLSLMLKAYLG